MELVWKFTAIAKTLTLNSHNPKQLHRWLNSSSPTRWLWSVKYINIFLFFSDILFFFLLLPHLFLLLIFCFVVFHIRMSEMKSLKFISLKCCSSFDFKILNLIFFKMNLGLYNRMMTMMVSRIFENELNVKGNWEERSEEKIAQIKISSFYGKLICLLRIYKKY